MAMQNEFETKSNVTGDIEVDPAMDLPYQPPAIVWREKFPVRTVIGVSNVPATLECGGEG